MRSPISIAVLLLAFAPVVAAQNTNTDSLADIARESRAHAGVAKKTWDDQNSDFGRSTEDSGTPCGAPIAVQNGYVSSLLGKPVTDPELSKVLVHWLDKHPDLDVTQPEDLAKVKFPMTPAQVQVIQQSARAVVDHWRMETSSVAESGNASDFSAAVNSLMKAPLKSNASSVLTQAVRAEQQRRINSDGSAADKLQEAVNLYSICESRRQSQFEPEIEKLAKAQFQKELATSSPLAEAQQGK